MCTVTVIPFGDRGFRLACNRDESRRRLPAHPPIEVRLRQAWAVMPVDADVGGTWVAASDRGLVFALLNYNPVSVPDALAADAIKSRGEIIPALLDCCDVAAAVDQACTVNPAEFGPFRLFVTDGNRYAELISDCTRIVSCARDFTGHAILLTSSGLGDALVEPPRRKLFEQTLAREPTPAAQDRFHRHQWPDRPHLSVYMSRADARTVSYTTVEVSSGAAVMRYWPVSPDQQLAASPVLREVHLGKRSACDCNELHRGGTSCA